MAPKRQLPDGHVSTQDPEQENRFSVDPESGKLYWDNKEIVARNTVNFTGIGLVWAWITGISVVLGGVGAAVTGYIDLCKHIEEHRKHSAEAKQPAKEIAAPETSLDKPAAAAPGSHQPISLTTIYFDANSKILALESSNDFARMIQAFSADASFHAAVRGYTDNTGSTAKNMALSTGRAERVAQWLSSKGVSSTRISSQGLGATMPIADNRTAEGRAKNRRVEIALQ